MKRCRRPLEEREREGALLGTFHEGGSRASERKRGRERERKRGREGQGEQEKLDGEQLKCDCLYKTHTTPHV